jgi:ribulose-5-phosphate 4-epimerase/fuculose-1-phosphate aldolase
MTEGYFPTSSRTHLYLDHLHSSLITASHILHKHSIFDAYGHISVRNPDSPEKTFFLPSNQAPALLSTTDDILEYNIEDAQPVDADTKKPHFAERFIHSEIYKRYPSINAVVHSHAGDVLPFCVSGIGLHATIHTAGFLGNQPVPVWDINSAGYASSDARRDLLVKTNDQGKGLAVAFRPEYSAHFVYDKIQSAMPSWLPSRQKQEGTPNYYVILMRGHGFTTCAESLESAVYQAIYTREAALVQTKAMSLLAGESARREWQADMHGSINIDISSSGTSNIKSGKVNMPGQGSLKVLDAKEAEGCFGFGRDTVMRPWKLWEREVEVDALYRNEVKISPDEKGSTKK